MIELAIGDTIHIVKSNADNPRYCTLAFVGGCIDRHAWALVLSFGHSNTTWLNDEEWHTPDDCKEATGRPFSVDNKGNQQ